MSVLSHNGPRNITRSHRESNVLLNLTLAITQLRLLYTIITNFKGYLNGLVRWEYVFLKGVMMSFSVRITRQHDKMS